MSNPFLVPGSPVVELQRKRRTQLRFAVYAILSASTLILTVALLQGCKRQAPASDSTATGDIAASMTNAAQLASEPVVDSTNSLSDSTPAPLVSADAPVAAPAAAPATNAPDTSLAPAPVPTDAPATATATPGESYVVKRGDTLWGIAKTHHTTIVALKAANGLKSDRLTVGKRLRIPTSQKAVTALHG